MVTFGAHCYLFTDRWSDDCLPLFDQACAAGLGLFEIAVGDDVHFTPGLARQRAQELGLLLSISPGGDWPMQCDLSADDPADRAKGLAWHHRQIECAVELEAVAYTGALYGHPGTVKRRRPSADEISWTAEGLHMLAEYGARHNVTVVLEPMSHFRTHLVNTPQQVIDLVTLADHPNLKVLLDTYHLVTEIRDYATAVHTVRHYLWGIHACENDRGVPGGGLVPWPDIFQALLKIDFSGYVLFETYNSSIGEFAYQRAMFHNPCPDGWAFVRQGLSFMHSGFAGHRI